MIGSSPLSRWYIAVLTSELDISYTDGSFVNSYNVSAIAASRALLYPCSFRQFLCNKFSYYCCFFRRKQTGPFRFFVQALIALSGSFSKAVSYISL